jgi:hypothetical protein
MQSFLRHTMRDGFFHADMHPGQSLRRSGKAMIVAVDHRHRQADRQEGAALSRRNPLWLHHP